MMVVVGAKPRITAAQSGDRFQRTSNDGFAIPVRAAIDIVNKIRAGQESSTIFIGQSGKWAIMNESSYTMIHNFGIGQGPGYHILGGLIGITRYFGVAEQNLVTVATGMSLITGIGPVLSRPATRGARILPPRAASPRSAPKTPRRG